MSTNIARDLRFDPSARRSLPAVRKCNILNRYMTLEPAQNKYIRFFDNIRAIQSHVISKAEEHMFPRIDNTNVDRSVSLMHSVIMKALRKV